MNVIDAYILGSYTEALAIIPERLGIRGEKRLTWALKEVRDALERADLLPKTINEIDEWMKKIEKYPKTEKRLSGQDASALEKDAETWRSEIKSELEDIRIVKVELQTGLNPDELTKVANGVPSEFICQGTWERLSNIEKSDLSDASKCLLLGTATPSVMVALRGAEACIRSFYRQKTGNEPGKKVWRQLTNELKNQAEALSIEGTFLNYLDYIGDAKRNFAQHPNKIYSLREAVMIFMQVVGMIEDVYEKLES